MTLNRFVFTFLMGAGVATCLTACQKAPQNTLPKAVKDHSSHILVSDGYRYRDLNKNGKLDAYEDARQPVDARVDDLLKQMTLEEKAGEMFINGARVNNDGTITDKPGKGMFAFAPNALNLIKKYHMNHFNFWAIPTPDTLAIWYNRMQQYVEDSTRLGIPITIASDPRNAFTRNVFAIMASGFSQWCEPLGFGAIGDSALVGKFADISRQEYVSVGIREALHPQVDLATEPRWPRIAGTFGEDATLTSRLAEAYILGYQGTKIDSNSVACMVKHFTGGGPQKEGLDPHFPFQKGQVYPGHNFDYHLKPFEDAFSVGVAAVMPYYGVPMDQTSENVGFSFNKDIITGLLRDKYHYDGVVCTDWGLIHDSNMGGVVWPARAWGVENLTPEERVEKVINAGVDQFGGENCPELIVDLVKTGKIQESRIDESVKRLLKLKFELGLFDNPFVDESKVSGVFSNPEHKQLADESQRKAMTLLKNEDHTLPLKQGLKIYVQNIDPKVAANYGTVVDNPKDADMAIIRLSTPFYPVNSPIRMAQMFHHGDLDFKGTKKDSILMLLKSVPTVVDIYLDRPAVIPDISAKSKALLADFGASDAAVLDVVFGKYKPQGHLPIEMPSSMEAVRNQKEDLPHDSKSPLYPFGFGLTYQ